MLTLHQYPGIWGLSSLSPFCIKVETFLRMLNLPYKIIIENNPRKGPKGKMPFLQDGDNIIPDSSFIIDYLIKKYAPTYGQEFSEQDKAVACSMQRMIEEHLYFIILYSRWIDPSGKFIIDTAFRQFFPKGTAKIALWIIRGQLQKQGLMQGIARHSKEEIYKLGIEDLKVISTWLKGKEYCLGSNPYTIDATVYAFLVAILLTPLDNPLQQELKKHKHLLDYCEKMRSTYFKEAI